MIKNKALLKVLIISFILAANYFIVENVNSSSSNPYENRCGPGFRHNIQGWIYLHIEGEPYERGYQYGYLVGKEIADSIERWNEFIINEHKENHWLDFVFINEKSEQKIWDVYIKKAKTNFLDKIPEEFKQEMQGMAAGVRDQGITIFDNREITFDDILVMQFVQDIMYSSFQYRNKRMNLVNYYTNKFLSIFPVPNFVNNIIKRFLDRSFKSKNYEYHPGHCSAFIATGEYTKDGGIVAAHSTVFDPLIAQRCNLIVNVKPSSGHSFTMTTFPGSLWSQEDWYQNEKGIILTETELVPQGPFNIKKTPKGVRSRTAIQYSETIDDVINILQEGNNGLIPNEWLIGDIKTGEIASLEQAYFNTPVKRTFSGFYGSSNAPHNKEVQAEIYGLINIFEPIQKFFYEICSQGRDIKFEELKEKYKGRIDVESAKEILGTHPICNSVTDGKITTSNLLKNNGLQVHIGNPNGIHIIPSAKHKEKYNLITDLPAVGWVEIYNYESKNIEPTLEKKALTGAPFSTDVIWHFNKETNHFYHCNIAINNDDKFAGFSNGELVILSKDSGNEKWSFNLDRNIFKIKVSDENIFIGSSQGIVALNKNTKDVLWDKLSEKRVHSISDSYDDVIFAGCTDGSLYSLNSKHEFIQWNHNFDDSVYVSNTVKDKLFFTSGNRCYATNKDGEILWSFDSAGVITSSPVYRKGRVFFGSWDNKLYCLDEKDGSEIWSFETNWGIASSPEITEDQVFVGGLDSNFYALDIETGGLEWFYKCMAAIHSKPVSYGDYVFFGSDDGRVYALDKKTGKNIWSFAPGYTIDGGVNNYITSPILSEVVLDNGILYLGVNNDVYALNAQTFEEIKETPEKSSGINQELSFVIILLIICFIMFIFLFYLKKKE